jgi:hypothetical protein
MRHPELGEVGATAILKAQAPAWWWLRKNFTLPAVLAIGGLVAGAGTWLWAQHTAIRDLKRQVADIADPGPKLEKLETRVNTLELDAATLKPQFNEFDRRLGAQEHEWQVVHDAAQWRVPRPPPASRSAASANRPGR